MMMENSQVTEQQGDPLGFADPLEGEQVAQGEIILDSQPQQPPPRDTAFGEAMAGLAVMASGMYADRTHPDIAITEPEARELAAAIQDCADAYLPDSSMPPWASLLMVSGAIALPRYMLITKLTEQAEKEGAADGKQADE